MVFHGTLPWAGKSVGFNFHAHMSAFQLAWLFNVSPTALKVPAPKITWNSFVPADVGLKSNMQMRQKMMQQETAKSSLVCSAVARRIEFGASIYDRHAQMKCTEWNFYRGSPFTVVSFNGPAAPGICETLQVTQHAHFWLTYVALDLQSHYTEGLKQVMTQRVRTKAKLLSNGRVLQASALLGNYWGEADAPSMGLPLRGFPASARQRVERARPRTQRQEAQAGPNWATLSSSRARGPVQTTDAQMVS